jgi:hypothetical protein
MNEWIESVGSEEWQHINGGRKLRHHFWAARYAKYFLQISALIVSFVEVFKVVFFINNNNFKSGEKIF